MQDIQLINSGQLFPTTTDNGVTIDRRLRQTHHQNQALKCPRCESLNTKFCYYNNYNLSQPRHFCKACRRYWTKGGVLRNVPVGGGCRKSSKRSSAAAKSAKSSDELGSRPKSNNSNTSSESSSLTGTVNAAVVGGNRTEIAAVPSTPTTTPPRAEAVSTPVGAVFGFSEAKYIYPQIRNPIFTPELRTSTDSGGDGCVGGGVYAEVGNFSNLYNETTEPNCITNSYDDVSQFQQYDRRFEQWQFNTEEAGGGCYIDPTVQIDHQSSNLGSEPLSWHQEQQQHQMFGLTSDVDRGYWSQPQWSNTDNSDHPHLYLP